MDWFEYTNDKIELENDILYRIKYLVDFKDKKAGNLSGYVSKEARLPDNPILIDSESYIGKEVTIEEDVEILGSKIFGCSSIGKDVIISNSFLSSVRLMSYGDKEKKTEIKNSTLKNTKGQNFDIMVAGDSFMRIINSTILCHIINVDGCLKCGYKARLDIIDSQIEIGGHPIEAQDYSGLKLKNITVEKVMGRLGGITAKKKGVVQIEDTKIDCHATISCKNLNMKKSRIYGEIIATDNRGAELNNCSVVTEAKIIAQKNTMVNLNNVRLTSGSSIEVKESDDGGIVRFYGVDTILQENSKIIVSESEKTSISILSQCILEHTVVENSQLRNCTLSVTNHIPVNSANIANCNISENAKIGYDIYGRKCSFLRNIKIHGNKIFDKEYFTIFPITQEQAIVCTPGWCTFVDKDKDYPFGTTVAIRDEIRKYIENAPYPLNEISCEAIQNFINCSSKRFSDLIVEDIGFNEMLKISAAYLQTILSVMSNSNHVFDEDKKDAFCSFINKNTTFSISTKKIVGIQNSAFFIPNFLLKRYASAITDDPVSRAVMAKALVI